MAGRIAITPDLISEKIKKNHVIFSGMSV